MNIGNLTAWVSACYLTLSLPLVSHGRLWTDTQGRTLDGDLESATTKDATVVLKSGKKVVIPLARLSPADRLYVDVMREEMAKGAPAPGAANGKPAENPAGGTGPAGAPAVPKGPLVFPATLRYQGETTVKPLDDPEGRHAYASENIRIFSEEELKPDGLDELVVLLESTRLYWQLLGLPTPPGEDNTEVEVILCTTQETFIKNGGTEGAAGFRRGTDNSVVISAPRSQLEVRGGRIKSGQMGLHTVLLHELVHQQTPQRYRGPTPAETNMWMIEGLAEYLRCTPYDGKRGFDLSKRLDHVAEMVSRPGVNNGIVGRNLGKTIKLPKLEDFIAIDPHAFTAGENAELQPRSSLYYSLSCIMVTHFLHTDRNGDMTRFRKFLEALLTGATKAESLEVLLDGDSWEKIETEMAAGFEKTGLTLKFGALTKEQLSSLE